MASSPPGATRKKNDDLELVFVPLPRKKKGRKLNSLERGGRMVLFSIPFQSPTNGKKKEKKKRKKREEEEKRDIANMVKGGRRKKKTKEKVASSIPASWEKYETK